MMTRKRMVKTGSSIGITFTKEERDNHGIDYGDIIEIGHFKVIKRAKK